MPLQIGIRTYSEYRINSLATKSKNEATKLRGWDGFCEKWGLENIGLGNGPQKRDELNTLYEKFHADTVKDKDGKEVQNNNINRLIVFNNMSRLVNEEKQLDSEGWTRFSVHVEGNEQTGLTKNIKFNVNGNELFTECCTFLEEKVINFLKDSGDINKDGLICKILDNKKISGYYQHQAVTTIQSHVKGSLARKLINNSKDKMTGFYPMRDSKGNLIGFRNPKNHIIVKVPSQRDLLPEDKQISGANKTMFAINDENVFLKINGQNSHEIYKLNQINIHELNQINAFVKSLNLTSFVPQHLVTHELLVSNNLKEDLENKRNLSAKSFKICLQDFDILHSKGFSHGDVHQGNLFLNKSTVYVSDLDSVKTRSNKQILKEKCNLLRILCQTTSDYVQYIKPEFRNIVEEVNLNAGWWLKNDPTILPDLSSLFNW